MDSKEFLINGSKILLTEEEMQLVCNSYRVERIAEYIAENHPEIKGELIQEVANMSFDIMMKSDLCEMDAIAQVLDSDEIKRRVLAS